MSDLKRVSILVDTADLEIARALLLEHSPSGFEELGRDDGAELAVYTDDAGEVALRRAFPRARSEPFASGWEDRWKEFHRPVRAGGVWIGPPWIEAPVGETAVVVDPGRAFGTGAHPTTRGCIELLSGLEPGSLLDAGCGSGVLAVVAAKLGFAPVVAVDVDPVAVEVAGETVRANGVKVDVRVCDALTDELPAVGVVVANIELRAVEQLLARVRADVAVTSGYLASDRLDTAGWRTGERLELEGWAADVLTTAH